MKNKFFKQSAGFIAFFAVFALIFTALPTKNAESVTVSVQPVPPVLMLPDDANFTKDSKVEINWTAGTDVSNYLLFMGPTLSTWWNLGAFNKGLDTSHIEFKTYGELMEEKGFDPDSVDSIIFTLYYKTSDGTYKIIRHTRSFSKSVEIIPFEEVKVDSENLAANGDFSLAKQNWTGFGTNIKLINEEVQMHLGGKTRVLGHSDISVIQGHLYEARVDVKTIDIDGSAFLELIWKNGVGKIGDPILIAHSGGDQDFSEYVFRGQAPIGAKKLKIKLRTSKGTGVAIFDNVSLHHVGDEKVFSEIYARASLGASGFINGLVFKEDGVTPLPGAIAQVVGKRADANGKKIKINGLTNALGQYILFNVPPPTEKGYKVKVKSGKKTVKYKFQKESIFTNAATVSFVGELKNPKFPDAVAGEIVFSGFVTEADGVTGIANAEVLLQEQGAAIFKMRALTDESGSYIFDAVPDGSYRVKGKHPDKNLVFDKEYVAIDSVSTGGFYFKNIIAQ